MGGSFIDVLFSMMYSFFGKTLGGKDLNVQRLGCQIMGMLGPQTLPYQKQRAS